MNDQLIEVRYNLYMALQYLRDTTQPQTLWIDALAINQDDTPERNQQIQIMGQIYKNSHETVVWLREEKGSDRHGLNLLHLCDGLANDDTVTMEEKYIRISNSIFQNDESKAEDMIGSLHGLVTSNWFRRMWVIQEFALSLRVILHCGDTTFSPDGLNLLWNAWRDSPDATKSGGLLQEPMKQIESLLAMRSIVRANSETNLGFLLFKTIFRFLKQIESFLSIRNIVPDNFDTDLGFLLFATIGRFEASDPRDCVFALLSLVNTPGKPTMNPDYNLTAAQVFSKAVRISSETGTLFYMLCLSCRHPISDLKRSMPSWVPDIHHHYNRYRTLQSHHNIYSAGGSKNPTFSFSEDGLVLTLKGKILDIVGTLLTDIPEKNSGWNMYREWYKKCKEFGMKNGDYPSGEALSDCWWRLLICDIHVSLRNEKSRASSGFGSFYLDEAVQEKLRQEEPLRTKQIEYLHGSVRFSAGMAFCRTEKRYLGWTSPFAQPGDTVCLLEGAAAPWVIRPKSDGTFRLVGEAYIHGIMYGEGIGWEGSQWEDIRLS